MSRNEELNAKFNELVIGQKITKCVTKNIRFMDELARLCEEVKPSGEYNPTLTAGFTTEELAETDTMLEGILQAIEGRNSLRLINEPEPSE